MDSFDSKKRIQYLSDERIQRPTVAAKTRLTCIQAFPRLYLKTVDLTELIGDSPMSLKYSQKAFWPTNLLAEGTQILPSGSIDRSQYTSTAREWAKLSSTG